MKFFIGNTGHKRAKMSTNSLVRDKTDRELSEKRKDLVKYIQLIDEEKKRRDKANNTSSTAIIDRLLKKSVKPPAPPPVKKRNVTPRSKEVIGTVAQMKATLKEHGIPFKSTDKKDDLILKIRSSGLINKVKETRCASGASSNIRAKVTEMKAILVKHNITFSKSAKKADLSALITKNKLIREVELLHMKNQK